MTGEELVKFKKVLDYFRVPYDLDYIPQTSGGNSIIMNNEFKYKEFIGYSINSIAQAVAEELDKPLKWID